MSRSLNVVTILGNIGRDAETKVVGQTSVSKFSVATGYRKKNAAGEYEDVTDWHNVSAWRSENVAQFLTKGRQVHITGRLQTRSYEKDGVKHYSTDVVCDSMGLILLGGGEGRGGVDVPAPKGGAPEALSDEVPF